jgi:probable rRNA maturation factor
VQLTNLTQVKIGLTPLLAAEKAAIGVLDKKGLEEISLVICGEQKIKEINKKYRHKNKVTDVLSFEKLNEIFICLPQAKKQAKRQKRSLNYELTRLLVHGIVHLKGYDHELGEKEAAEMFNFENKILEKLKYLDKK